jgi:LL-diaminopimelate aminotransferase
MRKIILDRADRLQRMPPELAHLDRLAARLDRKLVEIIDLSRIDRRPDMDPAPPPPKNEDVMSRLDEPTRQAFCDAVTRYYESHYGATLKPETEVLPISSVAAGLYLLGLAYVDPGEMVLVPDPGPPAYRGAVALCGGGVQTYYLYDRNNYIPDCRTITSSLAGKTKLWIMGYPHNPSAAPADQDLITEVTRLARRHNMLIVYDGTFSFLTEGAPDDTGFFANPRARGTGVEIVSFDDTFGLGDLGLSVLVGNKEAVAGVRFLGESTGLIPNRAAVKIGLWAMQNADRIIENRRRRLADAFGVLSAALETLAWKTRWNPGLPFCWVTLPRRYTSLGLARRLFRRTGVKIAPGVVYGEQGEGYARISLRSDIAKMKAAASRLVEFESAWQKRRRARARE